MAKNLIIVESPTKARTLAGFLGDGFVIESSYGHIRDLPRKKLGVDIAHDFEPQYVVSRKHAPTVKKLKSAARNANKIILATDEDREGEAIAWHLIKVLGLDETNVQKPRTRHIERIVFHEITKNAVEKALQNPRDIDMRLVNAQQARRILDRLVGYKLSPFLWKKVYRGLSAGRVQSVAVRLIVEREREIQKFKPQEYWTISALLKKIASPILKHQFPNEFEAALIKIGNKTLTKLDIKNKREAEQIIRDLAEVEWIIKDIQEKNISKNPLPPFTTSTLQQDAFRRLGFSTKQTMVLAQQLYENGFITYMRTDSVNLSEDALQEAQAFLEKNLGKTYALPEPRRFKTKTKGAQEAHEAIRPTNPFHTPESLKNSLDKRQLKLYDLIWRRFLASQMPSAVFDATTVLISAGDHYLFRAAGQVMKFDGFLKVYPLKFSEAVLPKLKPSEKLELKELKPLQHFTEPPPRYSEATLVKALETNQIGRPSTYAPIISTIQERGYVEKNNRKHLKPTETGFIVNDILVEHFPEIVDIKFTAKMEEELDEIARGEKEWRPVIREFYEPFAKHLAEKYEAVAKHKVAEHTKEICQKCGKPMVVKLGKFGKFLACSGFPECRHTKKITAPPQTIDIKCPKCDEGDVIIRRTKRGKTFYGCSLYPNCDFASWSDPQKTLNQTAKIKQK